MLSDENNKILLLCDYSNLVYSDKPSELKEDEIIVKYCISNIAYKQYFFENYFLMADGKVIEKIEDKTLEFNVLSRKRNSELIEEFTHNSKPFLKIGEKTVTNKEGKPLLYDSTNDKIFLYLKVDNEGKISLAGLDTSENKIGEKEKIFLNLVEKKTLESTALKIQKIWRGYIVRKKYKENSNSNCCCEECCCE